MKKYYHNSIRHINTVTKILILAFLILAGGYLAQKFFNYWNFQSPILFRSPFKRVYVYPNSQSIEPLTSTPTRKDKPSHAVILPSPTVTPKPKASIQSFAKYLTSNGAKNREYALAYLAKYYSGDELTAADNILKKEAGYRTDAVNGGNCIGIVQACPDKNGNATMNCPLNDSGLQCQLDWFVGYIVRHGYGTPLVAWNYHLIHNYY
jgi:hypothetical protein